MIDFQPLIFFTVAAIGSAINAVAGGGSFLLFPVLMLGGMGSVAANIMCTIAMWPGSVASSIAYWRAMNTPLKSLNKLLIFCVIGSAMGAYILLSLPEYVFTALVPWLLLVATLIFTFGRRLIAWLKKEHAHTPSVWLYLGMLIIAVYGGYFGAGIGILMLALLQLAGYDHMHQMNALKTVLGTAINAVAVVMFVFSGEVLWNSAGVLIAGGVFGGYVGTKLALKVSPEIVRKIVILIAFSMTGYFFLKA